MCIQVPGKVRSIAGAEAIMEDGRKVRLGPLQGVKIGDYLEVYADIALGKLDASDVNRNVSLKKDTHV